MITLVNTIFGAKKQNTFFLVDLMVLIPKMTLVFFQVGHRFWCTMIEHFWKKDQFTILAHHKI